MSDNRPIGVFDSGLGGLTAVRELNRILPAEDVVYFGDTGRVPYGTRSRDTIIRYTRENIRFLRNFHIKTLIIACGTASSVALHEVKHDYDFPIIGVVESAARRAHSLTQNKRVGVIGTRATIQSRSYEQALRSLDPAIRTFTSVCPLFVPLVEDGRVSPDDPVLKLLVEEYLTPLRDQGVDTLILGCTHYPLIADAISDFMGSGVRLVNSGRESAKYLSTLKSLERSGRQGRGINTFYVSDDRDCFERHASMFLGGDVVGDVHLVTVGEM